MALRLWLRAIVSQLKLKNGVIGLVKESIKVLQECAELQDRKSRDYQNEKSRIVQADYYPRGIASIMDIIHAKTLRLWSVLEAMENDPDYKPNFESMEDSFKDLINYASFGVSYCRGKIPGQKGDRDFLNREIKTKVENNDV